MKEKLIEIIQHYGTLNQLKYLHTEYFELDEAILEYEKASEWTPTWVENWKKHIAEELADTIVMLKQIQYYYSIEDEDIDEIMKFKIDRQLDRINNEVGDI